MIYDEQKKFRGITPSFFLKTDPLCKNRCEKNQRFEKNQQPKVLQQVWFDYSNQFRKCWNSAKTQEKQKHGKMQKGRKSQNDRNIFWTKFKKPTSFKVSVELAFWAACKAPWKSRRQTKVIANSAKSPPFSNNYLAAT